tara:strand:+ start:3418 stop:3567 length:150 start_codon:yes stop_codon:yes gene_type:complete
MIGPNTKYLPKYYSVDEGIYCSEWCEYYGSFEIFLLDVVYRLGLELSTR